MALTAERIVVSTTPVALNGADTGPSGVTLVVKNTHATDALVLGASDVTASTGFSLAAGVTQSFALTGGEQLFAIRGAAADITAHVLRTGM